MAARASVLVQRELEVQSHMISPLDGLCATAGEDGRFVCWFGIGLIEWILGDSFVRNACIRE